VYDPAAGTWTGAGAMASVRSGGHTATLLPDGRVLVVGGFGTRSQAEAELYDPRADDWAAAGVLADGRSGHTATLLAAGRVLVIGGANSKHGGIYLATAELYEVAPNAWVTTEPAPGPRLGHTATLLPDGQVLVVGGTDGRGPTAAALRYNSAGNTWRPAGALATARWLHTATPLLDGRVLVSGGQGDSGSLAEDELYDPATTSWTTTRQSMQWRNT